jgi:hypothetical protein
MKFYKLLLASILTQAAPGPVWAQSTALPDITRAAAPNDRDFVIRQDGDLIAADQTVRFGGANISWLGLRSDSGRASDARFPDEFEVDSIFDAASMMGINVIRAPLLLASAGCALCVLPAPGLPENEDVLKDADHIIRLAHDHGIKLILPLAGPAGDCAGDASKEPLGGSICVYVRAHGGKDIKAFFTDPAIRADFTAHIAALLLHRNGETGIPWNQDPSILAFETCDSCANNVPPGLAGLWTKAIAGFIHDNDQHHLVMSGAFASRAGHFNEGPPISTDDVAPAGIDIVAIAPDPAHIDAAIDAAVTANHPFIIENYDWTSRHFAKPEDLQNNLAATLKRRDLNGVLITEFSGLSAQGGYLADAIPGRPALYYPGVTTETASAEDMQLRARYLRRFNYAMSGFYITPSFAQPMQPQILSTTGGKIIWRGGTGAASYNIDRTPDAKAWPPDWQIICDHCVTDAKPVWQDPHPPADGAWYQITPFEANNHQGHPSEPMPLN